MPQLKYEMHVHTSEVSKCSRISAEEIVRFYHAKGYSGVCITDHFLNGNTTVSSELPWAERVALLCEGYERARREGERLGIDVFLGWEYSLFGTDFLVYGLDQQWLLEHPDLLSLKTGDCLDLFRRDGALVIHAHPFREADYIEMIRLLPRHVDGVETMNACRTDFENERADEYADHYGLLKIAGSDNHKGELDRFYGMKFPRRLRDVRDLIAAIRNKEGEIFCE